MNIEPLKLLTLFEMHFNALLHSRSGAFLFDIMVKIATLLQQLNRTIYSAHTGGLFRIILCTAMI